MLFAPNTVIDMANLFLSRDFPTIFSVVKLFPIEFGSRVQLLFLGVLYQMESPSRGRPEFESRTYDNFNFWGDEREAAKLRRTGGGRTAPCLHVISLKRLVRVAWPKPTSSWIIVPLADMIRYYEDYK
jgi:hypothetical protein